MKNMIICSLLFSFVAAQAPHLALALETQQSADRAQTLQFILDEQKDVEIAQAHLDLLKQAMQTAVKKGDDYELRIKKSKSEIDFSGYVATGSLAMSVLTRGLKYNALNAVAGVTTIVSVMFLIETLADQHNDQINLTLTKSEIQNLAQEIPQSESILKSRRAVLENLKEKL